MVFHSKPGAWSLLALLCLIVAVDPAQAQNSQFLFDLSGNLQEQIGVTPGPPEIIGQPQTQVVAPGDIASFSVLLRDGSGGSYQWYFNGSQILSTTNDSLVVTGASGTNEGTYYVIVSNGSGSVTSSPAMLYIDSDGDGLPDSWETSHFGNLSQNATGDFDHDGVSNYQEFLDGTNPADTNSALYRLTVLTDGGAVTVSPNTLTYSNGQNVTLTASNYFSTDNFRGWTGDTNSYSPVITLTMTGNKTVFGHFGYYNITWTNVASGIWNAATNWSPNYVPTTNDSVFISGNVTITLDGYAECRNLTLGASGQPTLSGPGTLLVHGTLNWSAGVMSGGGTTIVAPEGALNIASPTSVALNPRVLENAGVALWGAGPIYLGGNSIITNRVGAVFESQTSAGLPAALGGANRFDNAGTFLKRTDPGTFVARSCSINNYGLIDIETGTLQLQNGGLSSGAITISGGAVLDLNGGTYSSSSASSMTGIGDLVVSGATATLDGAVNLNGAYNFNGGTADLIGTFICSSNTLTFAGGGYGGTANFNGNGVIRPAVLTMSTGTLGGSNLVTVLNQLNWSGGTMNGGGTTLITAGATLNINSPSSVTLNSRVLENAGTALWSGPGAIDLGGSSVVTNRAGAIFEAQTSAGFPFALGGNNRFDNAGTFRKTTDSGIFNTRSCAFNNYHAVDLAAGTLQLANGGYNAGTIAVASGTLLDFSGGTFTDNSGSSISGLGNLSFSGATATVSGLVNLAGAYTVSGGTADLIGMFICTNNILTFLGGGTANFNGRGLISPNVLNFTSGTLGGSNLVTVLNQFNWSNGTMTGGGRTLVAPGATLTISNANLNAVALNPRVLENAGTTIWLGPAPINLGGNSVITNDAGAVFDARTSAGLPFALGGANRFDNSGTFKKTINTGTLNISSAAFNNYGTLDIESGILSLGSGYFCAPGSAISCVISGAAVGTGYGQLQVAGTLSLTGSLAVAFTNNYVPPLNASFTPVTAGTRTGAFASFAFPSNTYAMQLSNTPSAVVVTVTNYTGAPVVSTMPTNGLFYAGRTILLTPSAGGAPPLTYQWQKNGTNLIDDGRVVGANSSTLAISNAASADIANYQVFLTNSQGNAQSTLEAVGVQAVPKLNAGGAGWTLQGTTPPTMNSSNVTLTAGLGGTGRSVFYNAPLYVPAFAASFIYRDVSGGADGVTFCLHNDSRGASALGGSGGGLGYAGITPSAGVAFNIYGPNTVGIAPCQNGTVPAPGGYKTPGTVNIASGNPIFVSLVYTGGVLQTTLVESNTTHSFTTNYVMNIPAVVGGQTAYVGFTGGDGGVSSTQVISNFTYVPVTGISVDRSNVAAPALWWPGTIGGYTMQTRSNLAPSGTWVNSILTTVQTNSRNQVTIGPAPNNQFFRLSISLDQ